MHFLAGNNVTRLCGSVTGLTLSYQDTEFKAIQKMPPVRKNNDVIFAFCNGEDLCNGTVRLAEISNMMIVLPAALVLISFFFKATMPYTQYI